ncbi:hypothetical protein ACFWYW_57300 [Nonomuraea sp. NPDC059023]|uniref:hypothetical protein n=1 Tax=unclassified Nonomuraea TaxID=2593643 RepID=UPI0036BB8628
MPDRGSTATGTAAFQLRDGRFVDLAAHIITERSHRVDLLRRARAWFSRLNGRESRRRGFTAR